MRLFRRFLLTLTLLLLATAIWAGIYVQRRGFPKTWREMVEAEFAAKGYPVDIGRLTLGPFQGLVAEDVRFFQDPVTRRELAFVDNVILDLDLTDVLNRELAINSLDVKDATLTLPVTPGRDDTEYLKVDRFSARLIVTENQIEIARAQAVVAGVEVSVKGTLFRPPQNVSAAVAESTEADLEAQRVQLREIRRRLDRVQNVVEEMKTFSFAPGQPPRLEMEFSGDLADLAHLRGQARLTALNFKRGAYAVNRLTLAADLDGARRRVVLKELHLRDGSGDIRLRGEWPLESQLFHFEFESSADLPALVASVWADPRLGEVVFFSPPRVNARGTLRLADLKRGWWPRLPLEASGNLRCERFGSRGAVFDGLEAQFSVEGERTYVRNLRLDHKSGLMFANFMHDPAMEAEAFRFQTEMKLDPRIFAPFLRTEAAKRFLASWQFDPESTVYLAGIGVGRGLDPDTWSSDGVIDLRRFRVNNVAFDRLESEYRGERDTHRFRKLSVKRTEGDLTAEEIRHDPGAGIWEVKNLESRLDPRDVIRAVAPGAAGLVQGYRFSQPPVVTLSGRIDARGGTEERGHDFDLRFQSGDESDAAEFDFLGEALPLTNMAGALRVTGGRWRVGDFQATLFGGGVTADFEGPMPGTTGEYSAGMGIAGIDGDALLRLYGDTGRASGGQWTGELQMTGQMGDPRSVTGTATAELKGGDVMAWPFFRPALDAVRKAWPAADAGNAVDRPPGARLDFTLSGGMIGVKKLTARSPAIDWDGQGRLDRLGRTFSFDLKARAAGTGGTPGESMTVAGSGSLSAPEWLSVAPLPSKPDSGPKP